MLMGCATPSSGTPAQQATGAPSTVSTGPKRITIGIAGNLPVLNSKVIRSVYSYTSPGGVEVENMLVDGLADLDDDNVPQARMAEQVPSLENGLWKLLPDGRMETTWKIRENARWHDNTPFTTDDLLFTMTVVRDRELPIFRDATFALIEKVEASDARTITATWSEPFILADTLFTKDLAQPLPKHILETPYTSDKANFAQLPFWSSEFISAGPFRLKSFAEGTGLTLAAFDGYALGRPKIDEIEIRFIPDPSTLLANLLSGAVDATMGRGITLEQAIQAKSMWPEGNAIVAPDTWVVIFPQMLDPTPAVILDVRFRRALLHALDRQQMVDTIQFGMSDVAHAILNPKDPEYPPIQGDIIRYEYDPRQSARLIEEIGYVRAPDGFYQSAAGQRLAVEIWASGESKTMIAAADSWKQAGVDASPVVLPPQRWSDREYVAQFPGFRIQRQPNSGFNLRGFQSTATPRPETRYAGNNYSRYISPELDGLIDRYFTTVPKEERSQALGSVIHYMTDVVTVMGLYYDVQATLVTNRITGMTSPGTGWNAHIWDIR
jgi:peptide/nickel transport system substrate-binding protein